MPRRLLVGRVPDVTRAHHSVTSACTGPPRPRRADYVAVEDRRLAIVGDEGIHGRVGDPHWHRVRDLMLERLRANAPREAIERAVEELGRSLAEHYPRRPDDKNELTDEVSVS